MFDSRMESAVYFGYDTKETVFVNENSISEGYTWTAEGPAPVLSFTGGQLVQLRDTKPKKLVPIPNHGWGKELVHLVLTGLGKSADDRSHVGDLHFQIIYV